jgi:hypothetical protein
MQVQGLRVLAYGREESGQPKAKLQIEETSKTSSPITSKTFKAIFDGFKQFGGRKLSSEPNQSEKVCEKKVAVGLKHLVDIDLWMDSTSPSALKASIVELMEEHLINVNQQGVDTVWRMSRNNAEPSMSKSMTAYERALTSNKPEVMPWQARLAVKSDLLPTADGPASLYGGRGPSMMVTLLLQVTPRDGQKGTLQETATLKLELDYETWKQPKLKPESYAVLSEQFLTWKNTLSQLVVCEPVTPLVTAVRSEVIVINAGSVSGIRKGDEWLIADPRKFPSQLMGKDGASKTLLAQVENVSAYQSELTILAGPSQSVQKNWRAWPTETLAKEPVNPPSGNGLFNKR